MSHPIIGLLVASTVLSYLVEQWSTGLIPGQIFDSALIITILYAIFSVGIEGVFTRRISNIKTRYSFRKAISFLLLLFILVLLLRI